MKFLVVQPSGFLPYFLYAWSGNDSQSHWLPRRDLAKRFTRYEARRIADKLNGQRPMALHPVRIEEAT